MEEDEGKAASGEAPKSGEGSKSATEEEKPPEWLPDGWLMEVRTTKSGTKYRYYTSPVSGYTFRSRREVLHYLNIIKVDGHISETTSCSGDKEPKLVAQVNDSPEWLPTGWILEIKTRMSGEKAGQKYKCYYDPFTGSRFYSKGDVLRFLKSGKLCTPASKQKKRKKCFNANATDNVLAQIEYSPEGLPHGWIKEMKFSKCKDTNKFRKDPYYTDPVSGYIFRTLKDAVHYVETGEISKYAIRARKISIRDMYSLEKESPPPIPLKELKSQGSAVRRCLFAGETPKNGEKVIKIEESPGRVQLPLLDHASSQSVEGADPSYSSPDINQIEGMAKKRKKVLKPATENLSEPAKHTEGKAKRGSAKKFFPKLLEPEKVREKQTDATPEVLLIENPLEQENVKHLEPKIEKPSSKKPLEPETEKSSPIEEKQTSQDKGVKKPGSSKANAKNAITLPCRASKRLAGIEPAITGLETDRRSRRSMSNGRCDRIEDLLPCGEPKSMQSIGEQAILGKQAVVTGKPADDKPGSPGALPFGDSWLDPCIEFAVKTLTGDIPVLDDGIAIQDYYYQQLISVESSSPSVPASLAFDRSEVFDQTEVHAELEPPEKHVSVNDDGGPLPSDNRLPSGGKVNQEGTIRL